MIKLDQPKNILLKNKNMNRVSTFLSGGEILVVDDTPANLTLLTQLLSKQGYKVRVAPNGRLALKSVDSNPPDLILLDIRMPQMDGYQVCEQLKVSEENCKIPVIFISALDEVVDKVKAFNVGGLDYITKPFEAVEVIARIENQLRLRHFQLQLENEIKQRKETEEILYQSRALLASVLNCSLDGITAMQAVRDANGTIIDFSCLVINSAAARLIGGKKENLIGQVVKKKQLIKLEDKFFQVLVDVVETGRIVDQEICYEENGVESWYHYSIVKLGDGFAATFKDITEHKQLELFLYETNQTLQALVEIDGLTKVGNRRRFDKYITQEWLRCFREQVPLSLILVDVDYFKLYNDRYGHQAGDDCLVQIAKALSSNVKRPGDLVARYGGEEFAVILPNTPAEGAVQIAEKIRLEIENINIPHQASKVSDRVTISLGVSTVIPHNHLSSAKLINVTDRALYQAKKQGRNRLCFRENLD